MSYPQLFLQTFLLEAAFLSVLFFRQQKLRLFYAVLLANAFTHPLVVFGWLAKPGAPLLWSMLWAELFAVLSEAAIYRKMLCKNWGMALLGALTANLFSWEIGPRLSFLLFQHGWYF